MATRRAPALIRIPILTTLVTAAMLGAVALPQLAADLLLGAVR